MWSGYPKPLTEFSKLGIYVSFRLRAEKQLQVLLGKEWLQSKYRANEV